MTVTSKQFHRINFKTRFPALDGLRALAVTLVFISHYGGGLHGNFLMRMIGYVREFGWIGVDLFFVLSGFLITGILHDTRNDSKYFRRFYARRCLRIYPVYYATALVLLALTPLMLWHWRPMQAWFLAFLGNIPALRDFSLYVVDSSRSRALVLFLGHIWSLCIEEQFYLIWPLLVWLARTRRRILGLAVAVIVMEFFARLWVVTHNDFAVAHGLIFRNLLFRADTLMMGAVLAMLLRGPSADRWQRGCKWVPFAVIGLAVILFRRYPSPVALWLLSLGLTLSAVLCMGVVGAVLRPGSLWERTFSLAPLRSLGRYSYGFYLFHLLFLNFWYWLIFAVIHAVHSLVLGAAITVSANFMLTFGVAKLSYDFFELPILRKKRNFEYDDEIATHRHAFEVVP